MGNSSSITENIIPRLIKGSIVQVNKNSLGFGPLNRDRVIFICVADAEIEQCSSLVDTVRFHLVQTIREPSVKQGPVEAAALLQSREWG